VSASDSSSGNEVRRTDDGRLQLQLNNAYYIRTFEVQWGGRLAVYEPEYAERVRVSFNGLAWSVRHNQFDEDGTYPTNSLVNRKGYYSRWSGGNVPTIPVSLITFSATGMQGSRIDIEHVYIEICTSNPTPLTPTSTPTTIPTPTYLPPICTANVYFSGSGASVRTYPSTDAPVIIALTTGVPLTLLGRTEDNSWFLINVSTSTGNQLGWVRLSAINIRYTAYCPNTLPVYETQEGIATVTPAPSATATQLSTTCDMRDKNGVNVLARTAVSELAGDDSFINGVEAAVALMMTQLNSFLNRGTWYLLGSWGISADEYERVENPAELGFNASTPGRQLLAEMATVLVDGYCSSSNIQQAFQFLVPNNISMDFLNNLTPYIGMPNVYTEISIHASRVTQFVNDDDYGLALPVLIPGSERAVVVGDSSIGNAALSYQCPIDTTAYIIGNPNDYTNGGSESAVLSIPGRYGCIDDVSCVNRTWWWSATDKRSFIEFTDRAALDTQLITFGGYEYVKTCAPA
jgi:uncharacterized protein YraI